MQKMKKVSIMFICILVTIFTVITTTFAHSGRTDSSGGHNDNKNKSGLGGYHYHCGGYPAHLHDSGYCPYTDVMPSKVSVSVEKKSLGIGEKVSISATVSPSNACDTDVSWESSNTNVVQVHNGTIEAVGYGIATITASSINGKTGSITIEVKEIVAETIEIREEQDVLNIGDTCKLSAVITPQNVDNPAITWSSSDDTIATVNEYGEVQGLLSGCVDIVATASNGISSSKTITIQEIIAEKVEIIADSTMIHGDSQLLKAKISPINTSYQDIEWSIDDTNIATIDQDGKLQSHNVGKVTVTVKQKDVSDFFEITITPRNVEKIIIDSSLGDVIYPGDTMQMIAKIEPENATYPQIYWESSDSDILSIDENGNLEAKTIGTAIITAYTSDGCKETYEIEVVLSPGSVALIASGVAVLGIGGIVTRKRKSKM